MYQFSFFPDSIPEELKADDSWVVCDEEKAPMVALLRRRKAASSTDPTTWRPFKAAAAAFNTGRYAGVGRVIEQDGPYVGIDIDKCRCPSSGVITPRAWKIIEALDSYAEVSPSLEGVKIWVRATEVKVAHVKPGLEIYPRGRYFVVTGMLLSQCSSTIEERSAQLADLISQEFPKPKKKTKVYSGPSGQRLDLDELLAEAGVEILAVVTDHEAQTKYRIFCPWIEEHTSSVKSGTYVGQYESGALFFKCHHAHCATREWSDFRNITCPRLSTRRQRQYAEEGYVSRKVVINLA